MATLQFLDQKVSPKKQMSHLGFILSVIGAAGGLANVWRFPYLMSVNGGGSFIIAYLIGVMVIGVPLLILEISLARKLSAGGVKSFSFFSKRLEWYPWMQVGVIFIIGIYYAALVVFTFISFIQGLLPNVWTSDFNFFPNLNPNPSGINSFLDLGNVNWAWFGLLVGLWVIVGILILKGSTKGVEKVNFIFIPIFYILFIGIFIYVLTLAGANNGINYLLSPDWSKLGQTSTWSAAFAQVLFSMSLTCGIIFSYASNSKKNQDINNTAILITIANVSVAILTAFMLYGFIGHDAYLHGSQSYSDFLTYYQQNQSNYSGLTMVFNLLPQIFVGIAHQIGYFGHLLGAVFFLVIGLNSFTTLISFPYTIVDNLNEKFNANQTGHKKLRYALFASLMLISLLGGLLCMSDQGVYVIDSIDHWVSTNMYLILGCLELVILCWYLQQTHHFVKYSDQISAYPLKWWNLICLVGLAPFLIGFAGVVSIYNDLVHGSSIFPWWVDIINAVLIMLTCGGFILLRFHPWFIRLKMHQKGFNFIKTLCQSILFIALVLLVINVFHINFNYPAGDNPYSNFLILIGISFGVFFSMVLCFTLNNFYATNPHFNTYHIALDNPWRINNYAHR